MTNDPDSLKIVIGLAKENGRAEQQNEFLIKELEEVKSRLATVSSERDFYKQESETYKNALREEKEKNRILTMRNAELQDLIVKDVSEGRLANPLNKVVVLNYYMLSVEKTVRYCGSLDDNYRLMINSLFQFSLPDNTPRHVYDKVNEMTKPLGVKRTEELSDAMKTAATRPTNDTRIFPQNGSDVNVACVIKDTDLKSMLNPGQEVKMIELQDSEDNQN